jgi:hypothetical protein
VEEYLAHFAGIVKETLNDQNFSMEKSRSPVSRQISQNSRRVTGIILKVQAQERQSHRFKSARGRWITREIAYRDFMSGRVKNLVSRFMKSRSAKL